MEKIFHELSEQDVKTVSGGVSVDLSGRLNQGVGFAGKLIDDAGVIVDDSTYAVKSFTGRIYF
jgi:hypothetical protein